MSEKTAADLRGEADALEARAKTLREQASEVRQAELLAKPLLERLIFASHARCTCGAGMAYDPASTGEPGSVFKGPSSWQCSDILRFETFDADKQAAVKAAGHTGPRPFAFWDMKSEHTPSAHGATTRPAPAE